ncbi:MAG: phosphoglycerate dehydrogenase [Gammaproteobacteria bacterium]|nr:phosphoglycerate dehydrogenase [Gammaproteobacteria bacterium]MCW8911334.1 phosphoglycerate dehydrogenase [Gammaproteobacteria bacterium]MCW9003955.1 phosphoglycerate dehydrogenase [Gammaproteobacteria bacterium]
MLTIKTYNAISEKGLSRLSAEDYKIDSEASAPDAIMLRSFKMHNEPVADSVRAIGRAGAGVNNIPVDAMSDRGIVVFNAPGANANAVKELVIAGMLMACRNLTEAWQYTTGLEGTDEEVLKAVEAGKKKYVGFELPGKTLGVIGLGAIGVEIANAADALGMHVIGFDPTITVKSAWKLSANVEEMDSADELFKRADFVTFHVPLIDSTKNLLNAERLATMKDGSVILNFARDGIVDDAAVLAAIDSGKIHAYVTDFPSNQLKGHKQVITLPHLGASTGEAEENCAVMIANQLDNFLKNGNIKNSVNFPNIKLARIGEKRLAIANRNKPDMLAKISHELGQAGLNIMHMTNESKGDLAYTLIDLDSNPSDQAIENMSQIDGVLSVRVI